MCVCDEAHTRRAGLLWEERFRTGHSLTLNCSIANFFHLKKIYIEKIEAEPTQKPGNGLRMARLRSLPAKWIPDNGDSEEDANHKLEHEQYQPTQDKPDDIQRRASYRPDQVISINFGAKRCEG